MANEFKSMLEFPWALARSNQPGSNDQPGKRPGANVVFLFGKNSDGTYDGCEVKRTGGVVWTWVFQYKRTRKFTKAEIFHWFGYPNAGTARTNAIAGPGRDSERKARQSLPKAPVLHSEMCPAGLSADDPVRLDGYERAHDDAVKREQESDRVTELLELIREGLGAVNAFEAYCHGYAKHDISPRLKDWQRNALDTLKGEE